MYPRTSSYIVNISTSTTRLCLTNVVALPVKPVERLLGAICTIARCRQVFVEVRIGTTTARDLRLRKLDGRGYVCNVTLKGIHII